MSEGSAAGFPPATPLIGEGDPPPVELVNADGPAKLILSCDHASAAIPRALGGLGLEPAQARLLTGLVLPSRNQ